MKLYLFKTGIFLFVLICTNHLRTKAQYIRNSSLEGTYFNHAPYRWEACGQNSTPDVMPGFEPENKDPEGYLQPAEGATLMLLRARGVNWNGSRHDPESKEIVSTELIAPLKKCNTYILNVYLAYAKSYWFPDLVDPNNAYPVKLQVWGANSSCGKDELLVESPVISHTNWEHYTFKFTLHQNNYTYIYVEPEWDYSIDNEKYNGVILLDDFRIIDDDSSNNGDDNSLFLKEIYYKPDENIFLNATPGGISYVWYPAIGLSSYDVQSPQLLPSFKENYAVNITNSSGCTYTEKFKILIHCDTIYKTQKNYVTLDTTVDYGSAITLKPRHGSVTGLWKPAIGLNCSSCQEPAVVLFEDKSYTVNVIDAFSCSLSESFNFTVNDLRIPNVFTPNNDAYNDFFVIPNLPEGSSLYIYDKNGRTITRKIPYSNDWDGRDSRGNLLETGSYWYILENQQLNIYKKGFVMIIR